MCKILIAGVTKPNKAHSLPWKRQIYKEIHETSDVVSTHGNFGKEWGKFSLSTYCIQALVYLLSYLFIYLFLSFVFLGLYLRHMELPRLGVESELQPPAYITATATWNLSHVCNLHHSSWQRQILNTLSEARDWTLIVMNTSQVCYHCARTGTLENLFKRIICRSSHRGSAETNLTSIHERTGSMPGLSQWVKDLALPWAVV